MSFEDGDFQYKYVSLQEGNLGIDRVIVLECVLFHLGVLRKSKINQNENKKGNGPFEIGI